MNYSIFENDHQKAEAIAALTGFADLPGWKLIVKALDANIQFLEDQLKERIEDRRDFENLEQLYALQDRIDDLKSLRTLPDDIWKAAQPEDEAEEDEQVYETPAPEAEK